MTIRPSGRPAGLAAIWFYDALLRAASSETPAAGGAAGLADSLAGDVARIREALQTDDEELLVDGLMVVPGDGRAWDSTGFDLDDYPQLLPVHREAVGLIGTFVDDYLASGDQP